MAARRAYLDHNASAPLLHSARTAMMAALDCAGNPSSVHAEGRQARRIIEDARRAVAQLVAGDAENVVFTSGATEAASQLLTPNWREGQEAVLYSYLYVCDADHPCLRNGGRFRQEAVTHLPVDHSGLLDLALLRTSLERHDRSKGLPLVACHAANNETGVIQDWCAIAAIVHTFGGRLVLDAVQAAGRLPLDMRHADHLILSSHKIGGPKGVGAIIFAKNTAAPEALVSGGGQERGLRAGTENVAALAGFGAACREAVDRLPQTAEVAAMRDWFEQAIRHRVPGAVIHGVDAPRLPNTVFFSLPGTKAETAQIAFDLAGVALSAGSACSSGKVGPSHVLRAMGVEDDRGALRVSIGVETTADDLALFEAALDRLVQPRLVGGLAA